MDSKQTFDLVVIGAGTGGNGVARVAAAAGWKTAIIDSLPYGGTCALRGCDPKKMMVAVTEAVDWAENMAGKGLEDADISLNWPDMLRFKRSFTDAMPGRIEAGMHKLGVTTLHGDARFTGPDTLEVNGQVLRAKYFHIATGARPASLGIEGEEHLTTSTEFLDLSEKPARMAFVGGGFIALEFAHISHRAGVGEVTILQRGPRALPQFDPDLVEVLSDKTRAMGITLTCDANVRKIERHDGGLRVEYDTKDGPQLLSCDMVVHAAGRVPNIENLNLDAAGVDYGPKGIKVSPFMRSSNPQIFAAGDCADSGPNLTPVSANEARIVGKNLLAGADERAVKYPPIPSVVFTLPPLASLGLSEAEARAQGLDFAVKFQHTEGWYSSMRVGASHSGCKLLVENGSGQILGAHILGPGAEEQINLLAMAMGAGISANAIKAMIFAYPSFASDLGSMV